MNPIITIEDLSKRVTKLEKSSILPTHSHTGFDMDRVRFTDVYQRKERHYHTIYGADAVTAANYGVFFIASEACYVSLFKEVHQTAGSDAGAVTLQLEKLTGTTAPDSGTVLLSSALSLKATANTVQTGSFVTTAGTLSLSAGDRLCLKDSGTLTAVANVTVLLEVTMTI